MVSFVLCIFYHNKNGKFYVIVIFISSLHRIFGHTPLCFYPRFSQMKYSILFVCIHTHVESWCSWDALFYSKYREICVMCQCPWHGHCQPGFVHQKKAMLLTLRRI